MVIRDALILSDIHAPYEHPDLLEYIPFLLGQLQKPVVLQTGDLFDHHATSRHQKIPELYSAQQEAELSQIFVHALAKIVPAMHIVYGNHDTRAFAKLAEAGLPVGWAKSIHQFYNMPRGWKLAENWEFDTPLGKTLLIHGDKPSVSDPLKYAQEQGMNIITGHWHSNFAVRYAPRWNNFPIYGLSTGCLVDPKSPAFGYGKVLSKPPMIGCAVLRNGVPELRRMNLDKHGRWTGK